MAIDPIDPIPHPKNEIIKKNKIKKTQNFKEEPVSKWVPTDINNFTLEPKKETEYVSTHCSSANMHF